MVAQPPIEQITQKIVEAFHPRRVVLFGSRARGTHHLQSDVDLMIEMESDMTLLERTREVYRLFRGRNWAMDIVVYTPAEVAEQRAHRYSFVSAIEREGKVLYEQPE